MRPFLRPDRLSKGGHAQTGSSMAVRPPRAARREACLNQASMAASLRPATIAREQNELDSCSGDLVGPANAGLRRDSQIVGSTSIRRKYHRAPASSLADPEAIADADLVIGEALHREVLAEIPGHEIRPPKIASPSTGRNSSWYTMIARCSPPWPRRSPWPSPSRFSRRATIRPVTGVFQTAVRTVLPCHATS